MLDLEHSELKQRLCFQRLSFLLSFLFVVLLTGGFLYFCFKVFCLIEKNSGLIDWHILLIGSGLVLPATFIMYALVRRSIKSDSKLKNDDDPSPPSSKLIDALGDLIGVVAKKIDN